MPTLHIQTVMQNIKKTDNMDVNKTLNCPECGAAIDIDEVLIHQLEDKVKKDLQAKHSKKEQELQKKLNDLKGEKDKIEKAKENQKEIVNKQVQEQVKDEKSKLEKSIRQQLDDEKSEEVKALQKELGEKSTQLRELNKTKADIERLKREKDELADKIALEKEKELTEKLQEAKEKIQKSEKEKNELTIKEFEKKLADQKKLMEEMQRKHEQGSMQMQGEVQELALEDLLKSEFKFDNIEDVPKGVKGADVIQTVLNPLQQVCGKIIYESKRTKSFTDGWIEKLKEDQRNQQADLAIIVTEILPKDMDKFGRKNGVWICTFQEVKGVAFVLREMILKIHSVKSIEENKEGKMEVLYGYLTGDEFRQRIEAIVEGFSGLKTELDKEKRAMSKIWKGREKQIEKVTSNTIDMYASIKGIAGTAIQTVQALELGAGYQEDVEGIDMSTLENIDLGDEEKE